MTSSSEKLSRWKENDIWTDNDVHYDTELDWLDLLILFLLSNLIFMGVLAASIIWTLKQIEYHGD